MAKYLIEFRFQGKAKSEMKKIMYHIDRKFNIRDVKRHRPVPHISLVGPFSTRKESKLVSDFKNICSKQFLMGFNIDGFGTFENTRVVYINIIPDKYLDNFRWELSKKLKNYCKLKPIDIRRKFYYHATIAKRLPPNKFRKSKITLSNKKSQIISII